MPVIPATREAEAGELLETGKRKLQWVGIRPLHSSLAIERDSVSKKKKSPRLLHPQPLPMDVISSSFPLFIQYCSSIPRVLGGGLGLGAVVHPDVWFCQGRQSMDK